MPFFYAHYAQTYQQHKSIRVDASTAPSHKSTASSVPANGPSGVSYSGGGSGSGRKSRVLRTKPWENASLTGPMVTQGAEQTSGEANNQNTGGKRQANSAAVAVMHSVLKSEIESLFATTACHSTDEDSFYKFNINSDEILFVGHYSNIYLANHQDYPEFPLVARVFEPACNIEPRKSRYLKMLKFLDRRTPSLISTWDIFSDFNGRIVVFQEFAIHGNLQEYLRITNVFISEVQLLRWAHNLYSGMDFLGSVGICHRGIQPKHILLTPGEPADRVVAKLGSFRDAIVYYDVRTMSVVNQPCRSLHKRTQGNFQAPETYGLASEEYDPIVADVWSFGATLFFSITRNYPYNYKRPSKRIDAEIRKLIGIKDNLTPGAKKWFLGLLRCDTRLRTPFDQIPNDPWFKAINS